MKKALLIVLPIIGITILAFAVFNFPIRFILESTSPSGDAHVKGLRFQGKKFHPLDGTLRLFVSLDQIHTVSKQQTSISWSRDLSIRWIDGGSGEAFVVVKNGQDLLEIEIDHAGLKCVKGEEYLAADPYIQTP